MSSKYGALADIVTASGSIMAAAAAIALAWRGRTKWEPSEEDVPEAGQKVGALVAATTIVLMWSEMNDPQDGPTLDKIIATLTVGTAILFLTYTFLVGLQTYRLYPGLKEEVRIIGGFRLTQQARLHRKRNVDVQQLLKGFAYQPEKVWTRMSRQLAKTTCIAVYVGLLVSGTVDLAAAAIRLGLAVGP
jgi:hypothetical protein